MLLAHHLAEWSIEKGRRVGAVIVGPDNEIRSTGYNGLPRGVNDAVEERHSRITGAKYIWSCHAEQNAIFNAARIGIANAPRRSFNRESRRSSATNSTVPTPIGPRISPSPARC
jgi:deoxycytidylate deaminase